MLTRVLLNVCSLGVVDAQTVLITKYTDRSWIRQAFTGTTFNSKMETSARAIDDQMGILKLALHAGMATHPCLVFLVSVMP